MSIRHPEPNGPIDATMSLRANDDAFPLVAIDGEARRPEDALQMALVEHLRFRARPGIVWHSTPNEGLRSPREGARLKRMGLRPGAGDLLFVLPPDGRAAYLELKAGKQGRVSPAQRQFADDAVAAGAFYQIAHDLDEALQILTAWGAIR